VQTENWDNVVHTMSRLQAAQSVVQNSAEEKHFSLLQHVQTCPGGHPASFQCVPGYEVDHSPSFTTGQGFETSGAILYSLYIPSYHRQGQL